VVAFFRRWHAGDDHGVDDGGSADYQVGQDKYGGMSAQ